MSRSKRFRELAALFALLLLAGPLFAEEAAPEKKKSRSSFELGLFAGFVAPDKRLVAVEDPEIEPMVGLRMGTGVSRHWNWFFDAQVAQIETQTFAGDADSIAARTGFERLFRPGRRVEPFVTLGWGHIQMEFDGATDYDSGFASLGLGQHIEVAPRTRLRWEVRVDRMVAPDGLRGEDLTHPQGTFGVSWILGGAKKIDGDGDGVRGRRDRCPETPPGARVDENGCARDADRDTIPDGIDRCPQTADGRAVGPDGCPLDGDGDGIADHEDACPATPKRATIDDRGCALDGDRDGVIDVDDECPHTVKGIEVDKRGCFLDEDEDGVYDGLGMDRCPGTPKGTKVDPFGCPVEEEGNEDSRRR